MSGTTPQPTVGPIAPATTAAVKQSSNLIDLVNAAANDPQVQADLGAQFGTISHSPVAQALASFLMVLAAQHNVSLESTGASLLAGVIVAGVGYGWQWFSMRLNKPVVKP